MGITNYGRHSLKIFPNPTKGVLNIESTYRIDKIEMLSVHGQIINEYDLHEIKSIDLTHIENGLYILKIYSFNQITVRKILKN
ncbi:MAG: hypothetical protein Aureis2KO_08210 [Aureisphaera sp.]